MSGAASRRRRRMGRLAVAERAASIVALARLADAAQDRPPMNRATRRARQKGVAKTLREANRAS